jgi:2-polyprenyl-3-methyl-5-hydroxy-6-metoxy-1,4-benzoquinol methylase
VILDGLARFWPFECNLAARSSAPVGRAWCNRLRQWVLISKVHHSADASNLLEPITAYDRIAPVYESLAARHRAYLDGVDAIVAAEVPRGSQSLLDVGAGDGTRSRRIARAAGLNHLKLLDPSAEMRRRWPIDSEGWTIRAEELNSVAGEFDVITCLWNVLGHVFPAANRIEALRQFARLLAPHGRIFVDVNHRYNAAQYGALPTLCRVIYDRVFPGDGNGDVAVAWDVSGIHCTTVGHVFTNAEFCRMADAARLTVEKRHVIDYKSGQPRKRSFRGNLLYVLRRTHGS